MLARYAEELRVRLKHMQQRVHRLLGHDSVLGELVVARGSEIAVECLEISDIVHASALDHVHKLDRLKKGSEVAGRVIIRSQRVDRECLIIGVFRVVGYRSVVIYRPEHSAVGPVNAVIGHEPVRVLRVIQADRGELRVRIVIGELLHFIALKEHICIRKEPEDAAVQDTALHRLRILFQVIVHISAEASEPVIAQLRPERNDLPGKMIVKIL